MDRNQACNPGSTGLIPDSSFSAATKPVGHNYAPGACALQQESNFNEKPGNATRDKTPLATTGESLLAATKI